MSEGAPPSSAPNATTTRVVGAPASAYSPEQLSRVKADLLESEVPQSIGGYRIRSLLGSGGMGTVYEAEQVHPHRVIALKVIHSWAVSPSALRRFEVEAEALARLEHPYVARIYAVGTDESGAPYLAMERVKGGSLATIAQRKLKVRERLDLLARICDGVHYAHQRGVIHRDLKPSNIMVDDEGRPRILDFGVARLTDSDVRATTTSSKEIIVGTLPYMSPEQLGAGGDPDVRSDVYSLGVIGYELLTGQLPLPVQDKPIGEAARIIRETEPKWPSSFDKSLRGDVDAILMKALAKDPAQRYPSAAAMADDLRRSLSYEPVTARRLTSSYQLGRFILRNPLLTALVAAVLFALTAGLAGTAYGLMKSRRLHLEAVAHLNDANIATSAAHDEARHAELELAKGLVAQGGALDLAGMHADARARFTEAAERLHKAQTSADPADVAWLASCQLSPPPLVSLQVARGAPLTVCFDATGRRAWWADPSGALRLIDLRSGAVVKSYPTEEGITAAAISTTLDTASIAGIRKFVALDLKTGAVVELPAIQRQVTCVIASGRFLLVGDEDGRLALVDLRDRKLLRRFEGEHRKVAVLALSPDSSLALSGAREDGTLKLWDVTRGTVIRSWAAHAKDVTGVAFLPGGGAISAGLDQTVKHWDLRGDQPVAVFAGQTGRVTCLSLSRDGRTLLTGGGDQAVVLWDVAAARAIRRFEGHHGIVTSVVFSPDQQFALSAASDGTLNAWDLSSRDVRPIVDATIVCDRVAVSRDGRFVAARAGSQLRIVDCASGRLLASLDAGQQPGCVAVAPGGARFALGGEDEEGLLRVWSADSSAPKVRLKTGRKITALEFTGGGGQLLVGQDDGKISLRDSASGAELRPLLDDQLGVTSLALSKEGRMLLSGSFDHVVRLWDLVQARVVFRLEGHLKSVNCVAFSPDGKRALSGSADQTLRLWDLNSGQLVHTFSGHGSSVVACAFSNDGRWALSAGDDGAMRTWDLLDKTPLGIVAPGEKILAFETAPGGWHAVSESLRVWDFSRAERFRQLQSRAASARQQLASQADDPQAIQAINDWFAFRGRPQWQIQTTAQNK